MKSIEEAKERPRDLKSTVEVKSKAPTSDFFFWLGKGLGGADESCE